MGDALLGVAPAEVHHPFAKDRGIDQSIEPDRSAHVHPARHQVEQSVLVDGRDRYAVDTLHIVIGDIEKAILQVEELAGNMEGDDLARPVADELLAEGETAQQQRANRRRLSLPSELGIAAVATLRPRK